MRFSFGLAALLALSSTAFARASGPRYAVKDAYKAAEEGKLSELVEVLTGRALSEYGNEYGLQRLHNEYAAYGNDFNTDKELIQTVRDSHGRAAERSYAVTLKGERRLPDGHHAAEELVRSPLVDCSVSWVRQCHRSSRHGALVCHLADEENCKVADFR